MDTAAPLMHPHAAAIIDALVATLHSPNSRAKLAAAKLILRWAWGPPGAKRRAGPTETAPAGGLSPSEQQRAVDLLMPHLGPRRKEPNPAATSCPARHEAASPADGPISPRPNPAINPMSLEDAAPAPTEDPGAARATTPCPAADAALAADPIPPNPGINPMSRERSSSPLAAPPGTDPPYSSRRDADPMSRPLLPPRHRDDAFRRPLPTPPPIEPPWPFLSDAQWWQSRRRSRWR